MDADEELRKLYEENQKLRALACILIENQKPECPFIVKRFTSPIGSGFNIYHEYNTYKPFYTFEPDTKLEIIIQLNKERHDRYDHLGHIISFLQDKLEMTVLDSAMYEIRLIDPAINHKKIRLSIRHDLIKKNGVSEPRYIVRGDDCFIDACITSKIFIQIISQMHKIENFIPIYVFKGTAWNMYKPISYFPLYIS